MDLWACILDNKKTSSSDFRKKMLGYFESDLERFFWTNYFQRDQMMLACMTERSYINLPCFRAGFQARLESEE